MPGVQMPKGKKHEKKKIAKKLAKALRLLSISDIQMNLGAWLTIRRLPGSSEFSSWLSNTRVKKAGGNRFSSDLKACVGVGPTPTKALRDLAKKLSGRTLCPEDTGPCRDGTKEMLVRGEVLPK